MNSSTVSIRKCSALVAVLAGLLPLAAQVAGSGQLTEAQAAAMIQALTAQAQSQAAATMTQAQFQQLIQYMVRQGAGSPNGLTAAQSQMLLQALTQSTAAASTAPVSTAQSQLLAQMFASRPSAVPMPTIAAAPTTPALSSKKPGIIRIGVAEPKAQMGPSGPANAYTEPIRSAIVHYLSGPMIEVIPIVAALPAQIEAEAQQKECDYIVYTAISQKENNGRLSMLKKAMPMASMVPMVGLAGGLAGAAAGAAAAGAASAASISSGVKAKSDVTLEYELVAGGNAILSKSLSVKARNDGEDVITPLVEQADSAILDAVIKK